VIPVTRLNGSRFYLNAELVESVEGTPDTIIALSNGTRIIVRERPEQIVEAILQYRRQVYGQPRFTPEPER
jgi:flagellar protein FlbD